MNQTHGPLGHIAGDHPIFLTGAAGFIGFHASLKYLTAGKQIVGFDNMNDYYDPALKQARLSILEKYPNFSFIRADLADQNAVETAFRDVKPRLVINLAAQTGVRYSVENPRAYLSANIDGFLNILEACRQFGVDHLVYASSSSVYGTNSKIPFSEEDGVDHPASLYAATKRSNELMAHTYSHQFGIPTTGLRFFTVYGPFGRPDMAYFSFTRNILEGKPITVYRDGTLERDFTYIDDIVEAVTRIADLPAKADDNFNRLAPSPATSFAPFRLFNIGNHKCETVNALIGAIEHATNKKAVRSVKPMPLGDIERTYADVDSLINAVAFFPNTSIQDGINKFVDWYYSHYQIK